MLMPSLLQVLADGATLEAAGVPSRGGVLYLAKARRPAPAQQGAAPGRAAAQAIARGGQLRHRGGGASAVELTVKRVGDDSEASFTLSAGDSVQVRAGGDGAGA
jgi:hypothetical protein